MIVRKKAITITIEPATLDRLTKYSEQHNRTNSSTASHLISIYLSEYFDGFAPDGTWYGQTAATLEYGDKLQDLLDPTVESPLKPTLQDMLSEAAGDMGTDDLPPRPPADKLIGEDDDA